MTVLKETACQNLVNKHLNLQSMLQEKARLSWPEWSNYSLSQDLEGIKSVHCSSGQYSSCKGLFRWTTGFKDCKIIGLFGNKLKYNWLNMFDLDNGHLSVSDNLRKKLSIALLYLIWAIKCLLIFSFLLLFIIFYLILTEEEKNTYYKSLCMFFLVIKTKPKQKQD